MLALVGLASGLSNIQGFSQVTTRDLPPLWRLTLRGGGPGMPRGPLKKIGLMPLDKLVPQTVLWYAAQGALMTFAPNFFMKAYGSGIDLSAKSEWCVSSTSPPSPFPPH